VFSVVSLGFLGFCFFSFLLGPAFFVDLAGSAQSQGICRDILGDCRGCGDVGALADPQRGDQDAVAADKNIVFDDGLVFVYAIVVAGDGAGADIDLFADLAVPEVSQVVGFRAFTEAAFLQLDKIGPMETRSRMVECSSTQPACTSTWSPISQFMITL
jgi:hypothetical protein